MLKFTCNKEKVEFRTHKCSFFVTMSSGTFLVIGFETLTFFVELQVYKTYFYMINY